MDDARRTQPETDPPGTPGSGRARPRARLQERHQPGAAAGRPSPTARRRCAAPSRPTTRRPSPPACAPWASPSSRPRPAPGACTGAGGRSRPPRPTSSAPRPAPPRGSCSPPAPPARASYRFDAAPQLRRRPLAQLLDALRAQGARTEPADAAGLPLTLLARGLAGGSLRLPGDTSSQFISALLMAAPLAAAAAGARRGRPRQPPLRDMTLRMMEQFGADAERDGHERFRRPAGRLPGRDYAVEPDASTASYFFAAAAVTGGRVQVLGLHRAGALQGDVALPRRARGDGLHGDRRARRRRGSPARLRWPASPSTWRHLGHLHDARGDRPVGDLAGDHHRHRQRPRSRSPTASPRWRTTCAGSRCRPNPAPDWLRVFPATPRGGASTRAATTASRWRSRCWVSAPRDRHRRPGLRGQDLPDVLRALGRSWNREPTERGK